jgi:ribosomal protein S18 acetylase RimI-like enzyme
MKPRKPTSTPTFPPCYGYPPPSDRVTTGLHSSDLLPPNRGPILTTPFPAQGNLFSDPGQNDNCGTLDPGTGLKHAHATPPATLTAYCVALAARNSEALGFIPRARFAERVELGQVLAEYDNNDLCGYVLIGHPRDWLHIHQICIQDDARRFEHGTRLLRRAADAARRHACQGLGLRCASDLPSNAFWQALGFQQVATVPGGQARSRSINVYKFPFADAFPLLQETETAGRSLPT